MALQMKLAQHKSASSGTACRFRHRICLSRCWMSCNLDRLHLRSLVCIDQRDMSNRIACSHHNLTNADDICMLNSMHNCLNHAALWRSPADIVMLVGMCDHLIHTRLACYKSLGSHHMPMTHLLQEMNRLVAAQLCMRQGYGAQAASHGLT